MSLHPVSDGTAHSAPDDWSSSVRLDFDEATLGRLCAGPLPGFNDLIVTISLAQLLRAEYMTPNAELGRTLSDEQVASAHLALIASTARHGLALELPWTDMPGFEAYRLAHGHQGWTGRRSVVARFFAPLMDRLQELENERFLAALRRASGG